MLSTNEPVDRDERTVALENKAFRWAYGLLSYALLIDVAVRSFLHREQPWDLLGLVIVGGILMAAYQARHGLLTRRWALALVASMVAAAIVAVIVALVA